ncbi:branched-chain amino acid ABC transporter permease [Subtercola lobariae]|uniref:Branched-chain amino acid ABC transporter permease n=1 Tax=Subtercola lobariae TaxID=1588641 RepID=A0A917BBA2_9MICO|nr:branched-chain amino acid ABC transporter permease [Subtercola lobariae]GGF35161.1 branched-chain amino acid ABC transporter permease [Subtercola lobariae]
MLQQILTGLLIGSLYALIAQSAVLAYMTTRTINFAVASVMSASAFLALALAPFDWLTTPGRIAIVAILATAFGAVLFRVGVAPFSGSSEHDIRWILSLVALGLVFDDLILNSQGGQVHRLGYATIPGTLTIGDVTLSNQLILIGVVSVSIIGIIELASRYTGIGLRMRAVAEDRGTAELMGIRTNRIRIGSYAVGMIGVSIGAVLWSAQVGVSPALGSPLLLASFGAAIISSFTSIGGVLVGGAIFGVVTQLSSYIFGSAIGQVSGLILVILVLVLRPQGIFGKRALEKV